MTRSNSIDSDRISLDTWESVAHSELPYFSDQSKTLGDIQAISSILSHDNSILDLGCGWGRITTALAKRGFDVRGIDLPPNLIHYARKSEKEQGLHIQYDTGSMLDLPYDGSYFDRIVCLWGVLSHLLLIKDQVEAVNEMYRVLKPGGLAFIEPGNGESKRYKKIRSEQGFGRGNRLFILKFKDFRNTLYLHDRSTLGCIGERSRFQSHRVKFQNINHKRRIVMHLYKEEMDDLP